MFRTLTAALIVAVALLGSACGDDEESSPESSSTSVASDTTPTSEGPVEDAGDADCASLASAGAPALALEKFPDNPDVEWSVVDATLDEEGRAVVEIEPAPDEVGYPAFRMVSVCEGDGEPVLLGTYALDGDTWLLLFTTDEPGAADLAPELP